MKTLRLAAQGFLTAGALVLPTLAQAGGSLDISLADDVARVAGDQPLSSGTARRNGAFDCDQAK